MQIFRLKSTKFVLGWKRLAPPLQRIFLKYTHIQTTIDSTYTHSTQNLPQYLSGTYWVKHACLVWKESTRISPHESTKFFLHKRRIKTTLQIYQNFLPGEAGAGLALCDGAPQCALQRHRTVVLENLLCVFLRHESCVEIACVEQSHVNESWV